MSTSLSRQLEQLRTSSQVSSTRKDGATSVAALGPNILNVDLGSEELTVVAKEGLHELSISCPVLGRYESLLFKVSSIYYILALYRPGINLNTKYLTNTGFFVIFVYGLLGRNGIWLGPG